MDRGVVVSIVLMVRQRIMRVVVVLVAVMDKKINNNKVNLFIPWIFERKTGKHAFQQRIVFSAGARDHLRQNHFKRVLQYR